MDTQTIRLIDVFVLTPVLVFAAFKLGLRSWIGFAVLLIAVGTLFYNGANYLKEIK